MQVSEKSIILYKPYLFFLVIRAKNTFRSHTHTKKYKYIQSLSHLSILSNPIQPQAKKKKKIKKINSSQNLIYFNRKSNTKFNPSSNPIKKKSFKF